MRKIILVAALTLLLPVVSHAKSLEELLVEKGVITKGEAAGASHSSASKVYWNKGTRVDFPDSGYTAGIAFLGQTRYTFTDQDSESGRDDSSSFDVTKARIILSGTALHNEFEYYLQGEFSDPESVGPGRGVGTGKSPELEDMFIKWNACDWADVRMGQYKTAVSRQYNNSDWKLQFADRSLASDAYDLGRNQGLNANLKLADGQFLLGGGLFNGESTGEGQNSGGVDTNMLGIVNARFNAMGEMDSYTEGDVDWTEDPALSLGAAYGWSDFSDEAGTDFERQALSFDANFKMTGWSAHGELFWQSVEPDDDSDGDVDSTGFYAQVGYFIDPKTVELAARYSLVDCDDGKLGGDCSGLEQLQEVSVSINYFWWKHHLKAQLGYAVLNEDPLDDDEDAGAEDVDTSRWILQLTGYM